MYKILDVNEWNRKDHFEFFGQFDHPYFDICCHVDCTGAYQQAKSEGVSFFQLYLYYSLQAANEIIPFRYRIKDGQVLVYDKVNASPTIGRGDGTFGFGYIDFHEDKEAFFAASAEEIQRVQNSRGLIPAVSGENVIHYSSLPWINFTAISHARHSLFRDSIPKISFGKVTEEKGRMLMPLSVSVHHGLMDGYHVSQYIDRFGELLNQV